MATARPPCAAHWKTRLRYLVRRHPLLYRLRFAWIVELDGVDARLPPGPASDRPRADAPEVFHQTLAELGPLDGRRWSEILRLAHHLSQGHPRGPGLGVSSHQALAAIRRGGAGVCSDYSQVFQGLCQTAGIPCREWGLTSSFHQHGVGHAVSEVYVAELDRWAFLDSYLSVYATRGDRSEPLSMAEMVDLATAGRRDEIALHAIDPSAVDASLRDGYLARYLDPDHYFFVLSNNDVFRQDRYLDRLAFLPLPALHLVMLLGGAYQRFHVYCNAQNRRRMAAGVGAIRRVGRRAGWSAAALGAAVVAVVATVCRAGRWRPRRTGS